MKTPNAIKTFCVVLLMLSMVAQSEASETKATSETQMSEIATQAYVILQKAPVIGLEKSVPGIEQIITAHRRLATETGVPQRHLSLVLADAVAYAKINEIHRAELARLGQDQDMTPKSVPFDKQLAVRLWNANEPDFEPFIRIALAGDDRITSYVKARSSLEEVLNGQMIDKALLQSIYPDVQYLRGIREKVRLFNMCEKNPSPDESLFFAVARNQAFRDLKIIVDLYGSGDLPKETAAFRSLIGDSMGKYQYPKKRMDDGMEPSAFKVWLTYTNYYPDSPDNAPGGGPYGEYCFRQSIALAPFMSDTSILPATTQKALKMMSKSRQRNRNNVN